MKKILHLSLWILVFFDFIIEDFLNAPSGVTKLMPPAIILTLLIIHLLQKKKIIFPYICLFFLILSVVLLSAIWNGTRLFDLVNYSLYTIFPFLYFVVIVNENSAYLLKSIVKAVIILLMIQIPACLIKFSIMGITENYIGTISYSSGSISTVLPMLISAFAFAGYVYTRNKKYLYVILLSIIFAITGGKRAIVIFIPALFIGMFVYYAFVHKVNTRKLAKTSAIMLVISFVTLYITIRSIPTLNPENQIGGRFDPAYAAEYIEKYTQITKDPDVFTDPLRMRRYEGLKYFLRYLYEQPIMTFLLGDGPGYLLASKYNQLSGENPMLERYGVRYGGRMGLIWIYMQTGLIGVALVTVLMIKIITHVFKNRKNNYHYLAFIGLWLTVVIDTITYSPVSIKVFPIVGIFFLYYGIIYKDIKSRDRDFLNQIIPAFK
jgi:hypothetical protein